MLSGSFQYYIGKVGNLMKLLPVVSIKQIYIKSIQCLPHSSSISIQLFVVSAKALIFYTVFPNGSLPIVKQKYSEKSKQGQPNTKEYKYLNNLIFACVHLHIRWLNILKFTLDH